MTDKPVKNGDNRDEKGHFGVGNCANPKGRPRNSEIDEFRQALKEVEAGDCDRKPIFKHFIEQAYEDRTVLIALMRKILPDLKMVEADIRTEGFRIIIERPQDSLKNPQNATGQ